MKINNYSINVCYTINITQVPFSKMKLDWEVTKIHACMNEWYYYVVLSITSSPANQSPFKTFQLISSWLNDSNLSSGNWPLYSIWVHHFLNACNILRIVYYTTIYGPSKELSDWCRRHALVSNGLWPSLYRYGE